jgi:hypothetical protein
MNDLYDYMAPEEGDNDYSKWTDAELIAAWNESESDHIADYLADRGISIPSSRARA